MLLGIRIIKVCIQRQREEHELTSYANGYREHAYELLPLVIELGGCPGRGFANFNKRVTDKDGAQSSSLHRRMSNIRSQFEFKWKCRI
mmetsp:Transcript_17724/g.21844  ORF Transcript_17724/g.21844 Transcript_17724/m.21844 type:complete len:88 (-) Transcript_17724:108-371(-)